MDRRGLLRSALGVAVAAATTKLWVPPVSTALAEQERRIFTPPAGGWISASPYGQNYTWGPNESAIDYLQRYREETVYDVETPLDAAPFAVKPGDTVAITSGGTSGYMVVESLEWSWDGTTRLRGRGVESFLGTGRGWPNAPVASIVPHRASVRRSLIPSWPRVDLG